MSPLVALAFAAPIFGFALTPPSAALLPTPAPGQLFAIPAFLQVEGGDGGGADVDDAQAEPEPEEAASPDVAVAPSPEETAAASEEASAGPSDMGDFAAQLRQRQELGAVHRAFGIATWGAMLITEILGFIQYYNLYGFFAAREDTPCVQGTAVFGQDQCWGIPWPHRIAAMTTTALYGTAFTLSFLLPDPAGASEGDGAYASNLRTHMALRWVHLAGMVLQVFLGFATAQNWFGIDRANDFDAQRALASVHQVVGLATFGVLTAAGAIMLF